MLRYLWMLSSLFIYIFVKSMQSQGTVDNNLGPDRLAGPKALDPSYGRQPTIWLYDLCLEFLTVHGIELCLFGAKTFPLRILFSFMQANLERNVYFTLPLHYFKPFYYTLLKWLKWMV